MFETILKIHFISVLVFFLIYLVKTIMLLANSKGLDKFTKAVKVPEMIISVLFLGTGIYLWTKSGKIDTLFYVKIAAVFISIPLAIIGFKKKKKALAVVAFLLITVAYGIGDMKKRSAPKPPAPVASANGEEIYAGYCVSCHGNDGKAGLSGATDLSVSDLDLQARKDIIANGKGLMMPFKKNLTGEQVEAVSLYIESLRRN